MAGNSYGFWYPDTVIDVYSDNSVFTFTYKDSSYFGYEVEEPGFRDSRIPCLADGAFGTHLPPALRADFLVWDAGVYSGARRRDIGNGSFPCTEEWFVKFIHS